MKVVLIHGKYDNSWEFLAGGYLGAYLKRHRPDAEILAFQGCFDSDETMLSACVDADIVGFSCTSPTVRHSVELANTIKRENPRVHTVMGGYDPSARQRKALVPGIDQIIIGEGEAALVDIVDGKRDPAIFGKAMSFEELPFPDRDLVRNERCVEVAEKITGVRITSINSHRGCVFKCKFCADGEIKVLFPQMKWDHKSLIRYNDPDNILDEMEIIVEKYNLGLVKFAAPTWNLSIPWVEQYCKRKIVRGIKVPYYPAIHAGLMTQELAHLMKESGCVQAALGIESGSDKILKSIGKGTTTKSIRRCVEFLQNAGIAVRGYLILGMPEESWETFYETMEFVESLDLAETGMTILAEYAGTAFYNAERDGDRDWSRVDEYSNDLRATNHMTNVELKQAQKIFAERFTKTLTWHQRQVMAEPDRGYESIVCAP